MKNKGVGISLIIFLIVIIVILIGIMVCAIVNKDKDYKVSLFAFGNKTKMLFQEEYSITDIENIVVNSTSSNVKFKEGSSDKAKVTIYGLEGENAYANLNENKLEISKDNNKIYILAFFFCAKDEIIVELPKDYVGEVGVMVSSGNVEILDLEKSNIKVESKSGNILCGNMNNRKYNGKIREYQRRKCN